MPTDALTARLLVRAVLTVLLAVAHVALQNAAGAVCAALGARRTLQCWRDSPAVGLVISVRAVLLAVAQQGRRQAEWRVAALDGGRQAGGRDGRWGQRRRNVKKGTFN